MSTQAPAVTDRWISTYRYDGQTVAAVFEANTDSSGTEVLWSRHRGRLAVFWTRRWARHKYGRVLEIRPL